MYQSGQVHPKDLKEMLTFYINKLLEPVRKHFQTDPKAKELFNLVKSFQVLLLIIILLSLLDYQIKGFG